MLPSIRYYFQYFLYTCRFVDWSLKKNIHRHAFEIVSRFITLCLQNHPNQYHESIYRCVINPWVVFWCVFKELLTTGKIKNFINFVARGICYKQSSSSIENHKHTCPRNILVILIGFLYANKLDHIHSDMMFGNVLKSNICESKIRKKNRYLYDIRLLQLTFHQQFILCVCVCDVFLNFVILL